MRVELFGWLAFFEMGYFFTDEYKIDCDVAFMAVEIRNHVEQLLIYLFALAASADIYGKKNLKQVIDRIIENCLPISLESSDFLINMRIVEELYNNENSLDLVNIHSNAQSNSKKKREINYTQLSKIHDFDTIEVDTREIGNSKRLKELLERNFVKKLEMPDDGARICSKNIIEMLNLSLRIVDVSNDMHLALHYEDYPCFLSLLLRELQICEKLLSRTDRLVPLLKHYVWKSE